MTGKAIVAVGNGKVEIRDIKVPRVDEWDIRVALERSAISAGTESHVARSIANINKPLVLGYAPIGRIEAVGEKAAALFAVGDRVSYFCPSPSAAGPDNCSGGHQSPAVLNVNPLSRDLLGADQYCIKVPNGLSSEYAAFGGIAAVSSMGAMMPRTKPGDKVLVLGQGIIGQFAAQHFRMHGAEVTISDLHSKRIDVALVCGADHAINVTADTTKRGADLAQVNLCDALIEVIHELQSNGQQLRTGNFRLQASPFQNYSTSIICQSPIFRSHRTSSSGIVG